MRRFLLIPALVAASVTTAHADDAVATYALVLGSNPGGPGQTDLKYAEDDARKVATVLTELGGYTPGNVEIVPHPTPQLVRDKLTAISAKITAEIGAGRQARLFFYYSGHARATALDLGADQLPLAELRQRLFAIPATLTVVVLDACQSGAFSRVKGATPTADFSYSSKQHLDASGVAVLASSSGSELSQESERLHGSYFTYHFVVGLRGAGDANHDGTVSVDEAYRYAYHQTLIATSETAVGGQHVSLEVDLKGHGEVALSYPNKATSSIELPAALEGQALVEDKRAHAVVAETYKAKGAAVRIAVAPGEYNVLVRRGDRLARCSVTTAGAGATAVDLSHCTEELVVVERQKGGGWDHPYRVELAVAAGDDRGDDYVQTLKDFGYEGGEAGSGISLVGLRRIHDYLWVGGGLEQTWSGQWVRPGSMAGDQTFEWSTTSGYAIAHGEYPLGETGFASRFALYARIGLGIGMARTSFVGPRTDEERETFYGAAALAGAGIHTGFAERGGMGFNFGYQGEYAPIIENNFGQTHASGGHRIVLGFSYGF